MKAVRGMHDLFGEEIAKWQFVERHIRNIFSQFGYSEIRTPVLERVEVFSQAVGEETDIVEKQMYTLTDSGSEILVMRPEGTAAFMRAIIEHGLHRVPHPQRFYYYQPMFRHERPQKGRLRQFSQFGAELIQDSSPEADAELIALLHEIYLSLGITEYEIRINSVGCGNCRPGYKEALKEYLKPHLSALCDLCQKRFERSPLRVLDCKRDACQSITRKAPSILDHLCGECRSHQDQLKKRLSLARVPYLEDPAIVRGLDYYSRTAFEFTSALLGAQSALGAGGRYDGLSSRFGEKPFPSVGWALGMERLMMVLEEKNLIPSVATRTHYFFVALGSEAFNRLFPMSLSLKRQGISAEMSYDVTKGLKGLMKLADRSGALQALIIGDTELQSGTGILKNMRTGNQETISLNNIEEELIRRSKLET